MHIERLDYIFDEEAFNYLSEIIESYDKIAARHELTDPFLRYTLYVSVDLSFVEFLVYFIFYISDFD